MGQRRQQQPAERFRDVTALFDNLDESKIRSVMNKNSTCLPAEELDGILGAFREISSLRPFCNKGDTGFYFVSFEINKDGENTVSINYFDIVPHLFLINKEGCVEENISLADWRSISGALMEAENLEDEELSHHMGISLLVEMTFYGYSLDTVLSRAVEAQKNREEAPDFLMWDTPSPENMPEFQPSETASESANIAM